MKIFEGAGSIIPQPHKKHPKTESRDEDFKKVMDQARGQDGEKANSIRTYRGPELPPGGIQMTATSPDISKATTVAEVREKLAALEKTLDLLDFYADKLGDPTLKLTEISPMIDHLEDRLIGLEEMTSSTRLPYSLKTLFDETMTVMGTEIAKFKRGDYA
jgi:hypothetical protein